MYSLYVGVIVVVTRYVLGLLFTENLKVRFCFLYVRLVKIIKLKNLWLGKYVLCGRGLDIFGQ